MIRLIAKKEIQNNIYSIRFPACLVISAVLFIFNAILTVTEPVQEIQKIQPNTVSVMVVRQNSRLEFCSRGTSTDRNTRLNVRIGGSIYPATIYVQSILPTGDQLATFAIGHIDNIDWAFIIKIIFSLFAIIFTFDAICWEREQGTLSLICANPISRSSILLGKYLGACATLFIPLVIGVVLNLLTITIIGGINGHISIQAGDWVRISLLLFASIVYISIFVLLGLLISTSMQRPSTSLLILLSCWIVWVVIFPNLAGIIADQTSKIESEYQIASGWLQISNYYVVKELEKQIDSGRIRTEAELHKSAVEIYLDMIKNANKIRLEYQNALISKRQYARHIAMGSPVAVYQYMSENIVDTGFERYQRFMENVKNYYRIYENYIKSKVGKIVPFNTGYSAPIRFGDRWIRINSPVPIEYNGDMSDFPYFTEQPWSVIDSFRVSIGDLSILFFWNALLFLTTHFIFMKQSIKE